MAGEILLESGTNEVEIAIFYLSGLAFGANVAKIREFLPYDRTKLTKIVQSPKAILGSILLRGKNIPLIDLRVHLELNQSSNDERPVVIVTEFNGTVNGFYMDRIDQIIRVSWQDIQPLDGYLDNFGPKITGSVTYKGQEVLLLDLEQIIADLFPSSMAEMNSLKDEIVTGETGDDDLELIDPNVAVEQDADMSPTILSQRKSKHVLVADDSVMIRKMIISSLKKAGYTNLTSFINGKLTYDYLEKHVKSGTIDTVDLLISDIEMPQMDGLTLVRRLRENLHIEDLPVIMFSSLINEQMAIKCRGVGANGYITKPQMKSLVELLDKYLHLIPEQE